jgi:hypothetical protein
MGNDQVGVKGILAQQHGGALGGIQEAGAVEAIAPDHELLVPFPGQGVQEAGLGHGLVPGGIHGGGMGYSGQNLLGGFHAHDVGGIVQGSKVDEFLEGGQGLVGDQHGTGKLHAAVYHAVTYRGDLLHVLDHAVFGIGDGPEYEFYGHGVAGAVVLVHKIADARSLVVDDRIAEPYALHNAAGQYGALAPVIDLIFNG